MEFTTSTCDDDAVMGLRGDLDDTGAVDAEVDITVLAGRGQYLVLDMSALEFLDCSSLGALRRVRGLARRGGGDAVLAAPQALVLLHHGDEAVRVRQGGTVRSRLQGRVRRASRPLPANLQDPAAGAWTCR